MFHTDYVGAIHSHQSRFYRTICGLYKGAGYKLRILENGEIIERFTGKPLGYIINQDEIESLLQLKGKKLDLILESKIC